MRSKNKYTGLGVMLLLVGIAFIIFWVIFNNLPGFFNVLRKFGSICAPILYGVVLAFLINPLVRCVDKPMYRALSRKNMTEGTARKLSRTVGILFALTVFFLFLYSLFALVVPEVIASLEELVQPSSAVQAYNKVSGWIQRLSEDDSEISQWVMARADEFFANITNWVTNELDVTGLVLNLTSHVFNVVKSVFNLVVGLTAAIYLLASKERFEAQSKKTIVALCSPKGANWMLDFGRLTNKVFSGFLSGKIVDSIIIGVLCYLGMSIFRFPYAMLISVVIGVTNVIPFFGPFIGAVPSAILVLFVSPHQTIWFLLFILVLQQIDGNIIGPRILGDNMGVSGFWILVSITIAGGLFGFGGMLLGVPIFAIVYTLLCNNINRRLTKKGQPVETSSYLELTHVWSHEDGPTEEAPAESETVPSGEASAMPAAATREDEPLHQ